MGRADVGDGTYRNPVLSADWSDPDVVRVGADYFMVASSFNRVPGLPVLHSTDLVNWDLVGHALPRLQPEPVFATPQLGAGVWAPAIRHHQGRFWIFYPDPDRGIFVTSAEHPAGRWTDPQPVLTGRGLIDPCPLWDADGQAYLIHAWARSRSGFNNRLSAYRMAPDASAVLDAGAVVVDGDAITGCRTLEGPKWYRRDGWYWIFAPAGGVATGWQYALRSRDILGPYQHRTVLAQGESPVNGPHQGAWVTAEDGEDWFLHFQDRGAYGRVVHLQPMAWRDDGWPVIGRDDGSGCGTPVLRRTKPRSSKPAALRAPSTSDDFVDGKPGRQWTWPANPDRDWCGPPEGGKGLALACVPGGDDLRRVPNVLGQRLPAEEFVATVGMNLTSAVVGARAGLTILGRTYAWVGLERTATGMTVVHRTAAVGAPEEDAATPIPIPARARVQLSVTVSAGAVATFAVAVEGAGAHRVGAPFVATPGHWIGATLGLFALVPETGWDRNHAGTATFDSVTVTSPQPSILEN